LKWYFDANGVVKLWPRGEREKQERAKIENTRAERQRLREREEYLEALRGR